MGLLEKLKNTFFEEEYVEVDEVEKPKKKEKREVSPVAKKVEVVEKRQEVREVEKPASTMELQRVTSELGIESQADTELLKKDVEIPYFEDEDFVESGVIDTSSYPDESESKRPVYGGDSEQIYEHIDFNSQDFGGNPYTTFNDGKTSGFKPTPIISPIYGILDKNYRKEEVIDKKDKPSSYVSRKNVDLDFVRNKAFGGLEEDLKGLTAGNEEMSKYEENEDNLLYDMTQSDGAPSVDKVTLADAEEYFEDLGLEYNIDYTDVRHEKITGRRSRVVREEISDLEPPVSHQKKLVEEDDQDINFEDSHHLVSKDLEESNLEDNLFDLVDSMYEERE